MKQASIVTLLVCSVLCLVGGVMAPAKAIASNNYKSSTLLKAQNAVTNTTVLPADQAIVEKVKEESTFSATVLVARSTSLYDFQDGTRADSMDYVLLPAFKTSFGSFSSKIVYSQDLNDQSPEASNLLDIPLTYSMNANRWEWAPPSVLTLTPTLTLVIPASRASIKRDQLQTAIIAGVNFGIIPDGISPTTYGTWSLTLGLTAGRNFHEFEESVNGTVILNKYSSNQSLTLGYTYEKWSLSVEYIHRNRWTYQNNVKDFYDLSQELGYAVNDMISLALGHTNAQLTGLKANGSEPNFTIINDNDSAVYAQLGVSF